VKQVTVSPELVKRVNELLPEQPWKPGIEVAIIETMGCTREEYFSATHQLIRNGLRYRQRDGVVYDADGNVGCFDPDRVDPDTLRLIDQ
jgi:hypothetical protein